MKLSAKSRYGTMALLDVALNGGNGPVSLKNIAHRQQISLSYLEHLIAPLVATGIINSARGTRGGIWLARPPQEIKLSEIIQLLEGSTALVECVTNEESCARSEFCATRDLWSELKKAMDEVLESTTLQDLVEGQKKKKVPEEAMYYI